MPPKVGSYSRSRRHQKAESFERDCPIGVWEGHLAGATSEYGSLRHELIWAKAEEILAMQTSE
jgi:hypothetical protein